MNLIGGKIADRFNKKMNIVYLDIVSVVCYVICGLIPLTSKSIMLMFIASTCQNMENPSYLTIHLPQISRLPKTEREGILSNICRTERVGESLLTILKENRLILLYILTSSGYMAIYQMYNYLFPMDLVRLHGDTGVGCVFVQEKIMHL